MSTRAVLKLAVLLLLCLAMVKGDSFWIDEMTTVEFAQAGTVHGLLADLASATGSETYMPLGMAVFWLWERIGGVAEWSFRAVNVLWAFAFVLAFHALGRRLQEKWLPLIALIQPFLVFHVSEARPYAAMMACSAWIVVVWLDIAAAPSRTRCWWLLALLAVMLTGLHMFGAVVAGIALAAAAFTTLRRQQWRTGTHLLPVLFGFAGAGCIVLYYAWRFAAGGAAAKLWAVGLANVGFSVYELLGFAGIGPERSALREAASAGGIEAAANAMALHVPGLLLMAVAYGIVILRGARRLDAPVWRQVGPVLGIGLTATLVIVGVCWAGGFPFWGRHLAGVFPWLLLPVAVMTSNAISGDKRAPRIAGLLLVGLLVISSSVLRFAAAHGHDAYRECAAMAKDYVRHGQRVWWVADARLASHYGLDADPATSGNTVMVGALDLTDLLPTGAPDVIMYSKADIFDPDGVVQGYLRANRYVLVEQRVGFKVYGKD